MSFDEAVNEVLQQKKYDILMDRAFNIYKAAERLIENFINFLLSRFPLSRLTGSGYHETALKALFILLGAALLLAVAGGAIYLNRKRKKTLKPHPDDWSTLWDDLTNKTLTAEDLLENSVSLAASGAYREAVRYEFIALLWILNRQNILPVHKTKTNRQLMREIGKNAPSLSGSFSEAVNVFDSCWFGHKKISEEEYRDYHTVITSIISISSAKREA